MQDRLTQPSLRRAWARLWLIGLALCMASCGGAERVPTRGEDARADATPHVEAETPRDEDLSELRVTPLDLWPDARWWIAAQDEAGGALLIGDVGFALMLAQVGWREGAPAVISVNALPWSRLVDADIRPGAVAMQVKHTDGQFHSGAFASLDAASGQGFVRGLHGAPLGVSATDESWSLIHDREDNVIRAVNGEGVVRARFPLPEAARAPKSTTLTTLPCGGRLLALHHHLQAQPQVAVLRRGEAPRWVTHRLPGAVEVESIQSNIASLLCVNDQAWLQARHNSTRWLIPVSERTVGAAEEAQWRRFKGAEGSTMMVAESPSTLWTMSTSKSGALKLRRFVWDGAGYVAGEGPLEPRGFVVPSLQDTAHGQGRACASKAGRLMCVGKAADGRVALLTRGASGETQTAPLLSAWVGVDRWGALKKTPGDARGIEALAIQDAFLQSCLEPTSPLSRLACRGGVKPTRVEVMGDSDPMKARVHVGEQGTYHELSLSRDANTPKGHPHWRVTALDLHMPCPEWFVHKPLEEALNARLSPDGEGLKVRAMRGPEETLLPRCFDLDLEAFAAREPFTLTMPSPDEDIQVSFVPEETPRGWRVSEAGPLILACDGDEYRAMVRALRDHCAGKKRRTEALSKRIENDDIKEQVMPGEACVVLDELLTPDAPCALGAIFARWRERPIAFHVEAWECSSASFTLERKRDHWRVTEDIFEWRLCSE